MGGNFFEAKPEVGRYDASYGLLLKGTGDLRFTPLTAQESGLRIAGAVRDIALLEVGGEKQALIARNNDRVLSLSY